MKQKYLIIFIFFAVALASAGCAMKNSHDPYNPYIDPENSDGGDYYSLTNGAPRLVIKGTVTNDTDETLQGIYVAIYGVRGEKEKDILTYNYAITDSAGRYEIIRYRGRELPTEVTVVATDSTGIYKEQTLFAPVQYTYVTVNGNTQQPYDGYVTADFVLTP